MKAPQENPHTTAQLLVSSSFSRLAWGDTVYLQCFWALVGIR